jgi:hypothetical protein
MVGGGIGASFAIRSSTRERYRNTSAGWLAQSWTPRKDRTRHIYQSAELRRSFMLQACETSPEYIHQSLRSFFGFVI